MSQAQHRRHFERTSLHVEFQSRGADASGELILESSDVSAGGAFLHSDLLLEKGETLSLEFRIPGVNRALRAEARVAWVRRFPRDDEQAGMGVRFLVMEASDRAALATHLKINEATLAPDASSDPSSES